MAYITFEKIIAFCIAVQQISAELGSLSQQTPSIHTFCGPGTDMSYLDPLTHEVSQGCTHLIYQPGIDITQTYSPGW